MTARDYFLAMMTARRRVERGSLDYEWMTRAARKYLWLMRGVPTMEWNQ